MTTMTTTAGAVRYGPPVELKTTDNGWGVEGHVSTWDLDLGNDIVHRGAFRRTLSDGHAVKFLFSHDPAQPLGVPLELREDDRGLFGRFKISRTRLGEDVRQLLLDGGLDSFSIGYVPKDHDTDAEGVRHLRDLDLLEASLVALPMQPLARVTRVKTAGAGAVSVAGRPPGSVGSREREWVASLTDAERRGYVLLLRHKLRLQAKQHPPSLLRAFLDRRVAQTEQRARVAQLEALRARLRARGVAV